MASPEPTIMQRVVISEAAWEVVLELLDQAAARNKVNKRARLGYTVVAEQIRSQRTRSY